MQSQMHFQLRKHCAAGFLRANQLAFVSILGFKVFAKPYRWPCFVFEFATLGPCHLWNPSEKVSYSIQVQTTAAAKPVPHTLKPYTPKPQSPMSHADVNQPDHETL